MNLRGSTSISKWFVLIFALLGISSTNGSPGDDLDEFNDCCFQCEQISCYKNPHYIVEKNFGEDTQGPYNPEWHFETDELPFYLRILKWDCHQDCDYKCQRLITKERKLKGEEVYQFHGKWPFLRVFGIQEFFSSLFSIGNLVVHVLGLSKIIKVLNSNLPFNLKYQFTNTVVLSIITIAAWMFSTIFHIRDFIMTERLDYYFAGLTVLSGFHSIFSRTMRLYLPSRCLTRWLFTASCIVVYYLHIYRLVVDWSYTYNMQANVTIGILQNIFLCILCFNLYLKYYELERNEKHPSKSHLDHINTDRILLQSFYGTSAKLYSLYPLILSAIVILGMLLEIFDFPPFFFDLIDAHSLWHFATIIPAFYGWYDWVIWDVKENVWNDIKDTELKKNE